MATLHCKLFSHYCVAADIGVVLSDDTLVILLSYNGCHNTLFEYIRFISDREYLQLLRCRTKLENRGFSNLEKNPHLHTGSSDAKAQSR